MSMNRDRLYYLYERRRGEQGSGQPVSFGYWRDVTRRVATLNESFPEWFHWVGPFGRRYLTTSPVLGSADASTN